MIGERSFLEDLFFYFILFMDERKGFRIVFFWLFIGWGL
jgi:hypothetical protein